MGLSEEEAARRLAARPPVPETSSRSYGSIVRSNVLTLFNLILLFFGILTLAFGQLQDALFLVILVANSGIGIAQEVRAKRTLDRLSALVAPTARVLRDGKTRRLTVAEVVEGDLVELQAGDQVVGDGKLERADGLLLDESILTGESAPVERRIGDEVRSGSFAAEGAGSYRVTAVGPASYASRVAGQARGGERRGERGAAPSSSRRVAGSRVAGGWSATSTPYEWASRDGRLRPAAVGGADRLEELGRT